MQRSRNTAEEIRFECYRTDKRLILFLPLLLLFIGIFTRWVSGSPLATLHYLEVRDRVPPSWIMVILFSIFYIVAGLSLGVALGSRFCSCREKKYQGAMWFCICLSLGYAWYPIFFCARLFLISLFTCLLSLFAGICASICFYRVSSLSFILALIYNAWLAYLAILNIQIFFAV